MIYDYLLDRYYDKPLSISSKFKTHHSHCYFDGPDPLPLRETSLVLGKNPIFNIHQSQSLYKLYIITYILIISIYSYLRYPQHL